MQHTETWLTIALQKEKEELDDISTELELADEDDKIQYALIMTMRTQSLAYLWSS